MDHSKTEIQQSNSKSCHHVWCLDKASFLALLAATCFLCFHSCMQLSLAGNTWLWHLCIYNLLIVWPQWLSLTMEEVSTTPCSCILLMLYSQITLPSSTCLGEPAPRPPVTLAAVLLCCCLFGARKKKSPSPLSQEGCLAGWDFILRVFLSPFQIRPLLNLSLWVQALAPSINLPGALSCILYIR